MSRSESHAVFLECSDCFELMPNLCTFICTYMLRMWRSQDRRRKIVNKRTNCRRSSSSSCFYCSAHPTGKLFWELLFRFWGLWGGDYSFRRQFMLRGKERKRIGICHNSNCNNLGWCRFNKLSLLQPANSVRFSKRVCRMRVHTSAMLCSRSMSGKNFRNFAEQISSRSCIPFRQKLQYLLIKTTCGSLAWAMSMCAEHECAAIKAVSHSHRIEYVFFGEMCVYV